MASVSIVFAWLFIAYVIPKPTKCIILDSVASKGTLEYYKGGKRLNRTFYLILKDEKGNIFSLRVRPMVTYQSKIGEIKTFNINGSDINGSDSDTILLSIISAIVIVSFLITLICLIPESNEHMAGENMSSSMKFLLFQSFPLR